MYTWVCGGWDFFAPCEGDRADAYDLTFVFNVYLSAVRPILPNFTDT